MLQNVERVWLAEQKDLKEKKKLGELQKQLQEERQMQELRQLQVESGHKVKTVDTSLDWMYQGPSSEVQKQQSSEEYLLGKIFKPKNEVTQDFKKGYFSNTYFPDYYIQRVIMYRGCARSEVAGQSLEQKRLLHPRPRGSDSVHQTRGAKGMLLSYSPL
jgi:hypothetical protein